MADAAASYLNFKSGMTALQVNMTGFQAPPTGLL